jgi:hypothetical protein
MWTSASGRGPAGLAAPAGAQRARAARPPRAAITAPPAPPAPPEAGASAAVFQAPHEAQRPNQRDSSFPHAEQKKWAFGALGVARVI